MVLNESYYFGIGPKAIYAALSPFVQCLLPLFRGAECHFDSRELGCIELDQAVRAIVKQRV